MQKPSAKAGDPLPQFPLKTNPINRDNSPPVVPSTRQSSGNVNANSTSQARYFYSNRTDSYSTSDATNSFLKPKTHGRNTSNTDNSNNSFFFQNFNHHHQEHQPRYQSEDEGYTESYDIYDGKIDTSLHTRFITSLKKLSGQYEMDLNNFNRHLSDERSQLEGKIMNLAKEKQELQNLIKQKEELISTYMRKSDELQSHHTNQVTALNERYESLNKDIQAFSTFCKEKSRTIDKEEDNTLLLYKKRCDEQNKILSSIKEKVGNCKFINIKKDTGVPLDYVIENYQQEKKLIDSIKQLLSQKPMNFPKDFKDYHENVRNYTSSEGLVRNEIVETLKGMVNSFNRDKRGSIYVKDDISKQVRDLKKNLKVFTQVIGDPKILELLESLIQLESTAINQIITRKKIETGNTSTQMEDYWYAIFLPYTGYAKTLASANDYAYIDLAYIMTLLSHTDNFSFNYLLETSMIWGNRHWFYIAKDSLFNKYILAKLDPEIEKSISSSILQLMKRPDNFKSGGEMLEFFDSFCGHLPQPIDPETGNNLWHIAAIHNNGLMIDYLTSHEEYYPSLKAINQAGKTALDICGPEVKEKLVWATVFQLASEAFDLYRQSQYIEACDIYLKAIKLSEDLLDLEGEHSTKMSRENLAKLYTNKAKALIQLGDWLEAIEDCEKSLDLNSDLKSVYFTLITLYENLLDWKSALDVCNRLYEKFKVYERTKMTELKEQLNATRFQILQLPSSATTEEIKRSYLKMCKIWHPDKVTNDNSNIKKRHQNQFNRINEAKEFLENQINRQTESNKRESKYLAPKPSDLTTKNLPNLRTKPKDPSSRNDKNKSPNEKPINFDEGSPSSDSNSRSKTPYSNKDYNFTKKPSSNDKEKSSNDSKTNSYGDTSFPKGDTNVDNGNDAEDNDLSSISDEQLQTNLEVVNKSMKYFLQDRKAKEQELAELQLKRKESPNYNLQLESIVSKEVASLSSRYDKKAKEHQKLSAEIERRANNSQSNNINKGQTSPPSQDKSPSLSEFINANNPQSNKDFSNADEDIFKKPTKDKSNPQKDLNQLNYTNTDTKGINFNEKNDYDSSINDWIGDKDDLDDSFYSPLNSPLSKPSNAHPSIFEKRRLKGARTYTDPFEEPNGSSEIKFEPMPSPSTFPPFPDSQSLAPEFPGEQDTHKHFDTEIPERKKNSKKSPYSSTISNHDKKSPNSSTVINHDKFREASPSKIQNSNIDINNDQDKFQDDFHLQKSATKNKIPSKPSKRKKNKNLGPSSTDSNEVFKMEDKAGSINLIPSVHDETLFYTDPLHPSHFSTHPHNTTITFEDPHSSYATESEPEHRSNDHMFSAPYVKFPSFESEDLKLENSNNNEPLLSEYYSFPYEKFTSDGHKNSYEPLPYNQKNSIFEHQRDVNLDQSSFYKSNPNKFTETATHSPQQ